MEFRFSRLVVIVFVLLCLGTPLHALVLPPPETTQVDPGKEAARLELAAAQRDTLERDVARRPAGDGAVAVKGELRQWHKVTLDLAGPFAAETDRLPNPFTDLRFDVTFTHESGSPEYRIPGYFAADGNAGTTSATSGTVWRAHLSPDKPGRWSYRITFVSGPSVATSGGGAPLAPYDGQSGIFLVAQTNKSGRDFRGKGRLTYTGGHYLRHAGTGQPFIKAGPDSPETLLAYSDFDGTIALKKNASLKTWAPHRGDWREGDPTWQAGKGKGLIGALNYLAAKGLNSFSFLTYNAAGDGDNVWPFISRDEKFHYDCSKLDQWGVVFDHATKLGLHLHFKLQEQENDDHRITAKRVEGSVPESLDGGKTGPERRLYLRELIARFGHNLGMLWNLGEENTQSADEQRAMADFIAATDPYHHHLVIHSFPQDQDRVYEALIGQQSVLTGASTQNLWSASHRQTLRWVRASAAAGRPWVVANDEQGPASVGVPPDIGFRGYAGIGNDGKTIGFDRHDIRQATLWGTLMAGGAGVEYLFGYQVAENDLNLEDFRSRERAWDDCRIALEFFADHKIPVEQMTNADELVDNPTHDNSRFCFAQPGQLYLVYLPKGGSAPLNLSAARGEFSVSWFNPREGGPQLTATPVAGGSTVMLSAPSQDDWLAVLRRADAAMSPSETPDPVFPYGAVYFRKSNPPAADWERDHATAVQSGMNNFRHWFIWSAIEVAPDRYDWRDYDRMMDLAAQNGIKVTLAEIVHAAPEWMFDQYAHARLRASDDSVAHSQNWVSAAVGGAPGLCLDNDDVRARAERFLTALVTRYRNHPAAWAWDLANEHSAQGGTPAKMYCFCEATQAKFRTWLKAKHGSLEKLREAWGRYSYATWENVHPPRSFSGYAESLDWLEFRNDNHFAERQWRTDLVRRLDPRNRITAHGVAGTLEGLARAANDEWRSAAQVDIWGFTWVASRKGSEPWKQFHAVDLVRAGSRGKPFWHAEAQAGPLWMQPQVLKRPREDGRITSAEDVRLWNFISMAGGATGILYPRWRPLLDGPLFGAFGPFGMDGGPTPRSEMAGEIARWANAHADVWKSKPVQGDVGIVYVPESQLFNYVQQGDTQHYAESMRGAYQAFFDSNIQADFVHLDDLAQYPLVYLPYPIHLKEASVRKLVAYVQAGGNLVCEGLPGYFGERGSVGPTQPGGALHSLFGAAESDVEFTPDLLENLTLKVNDRTVGGRYFIQHYTPDGGRIVGQFVGGGNAAIEHHFGRGRTLLIGTFPGAAYFLHHAEETKAFFASLLPWAQLAQGVRVSVPEVQARLHTGPGGAYLWVLNPTGQPRSLSVTLEPRHGSFAGGRDVWRPASRLTVSENQRIELTVGAKDAAVVLLERRP